MEGRFEEEPAWYNEGVQLLKEFQGESGGWGVPSQSSVALVPVDTDPPVSTAFAMLFLLRSTRESIEKVVVADGSLAAVKVCPRI